jgi:hypothetical protein
MIEPFINNVKGFTRNPLGIVALFISLIYGFACLVLSTSLNNLQGDQERLPLIWFIIIFPIIILISFIYLVIYHHEKLYSPSDFKEDDAFIKILDNRKVKEKRLLEVKELESAILKDDAVTTSKKDSNINTESKEQDLISHPPTNETIEAKIESLEEIYSNCEKWAAQELSIKYNIIFKTGVTLLTGAGNIQMDAYASSSTKTFIAEIKYWEANKSDNQLKFSIQKFLGQYPRLEKIFKRNKEIKIIIVLVFDNLKKINQIDYLNFVQSIYSDANVEFFEYSELKANNE